MASSSYSVPTSNHLHPGYSHALLREWQTDGLSYNASNFVYPIFVLDEDGKKNEIKSMPGQYQWSVDLLPELLDPLVELGLRSVILFGVTLTHKDLEATWADNKESPVIRALKFLSARYPQLYLICDVCLCQYTSHGHCGILKEVAGVNDIDNDVSVARLAEISVNYALAGAHMIAPSDMMDGRIGAIKDGLRKAGLVRRVPVMSYSAKFASCMYGPFRDAAHSKPGFGDRKSYQLPIGASQLALRALLRDVEEGADFLMVKPGGPYLDIIQTAKEKTNLPISVYQVSGEFAMLYHAAQAGVFDLRTGVNESIISLRRAGADIIITYFTPQILQWLRDDLEVAASVLKK